MKCFRNSRFTFKVCADRHLFLLKKGINSCLHNVYILCTWFTYVYMIYIITYCFHPYWFLWRLKMSIFLCRSRQRSLFGPRTKFQNAIVVSKVLLVQGVGKNHSTIKTKWVVVAFVLINSINIFYYNILWFTQLYFRAKPRLINCSST